MSVLFLFLLVLSLVNSDSEKNCSILLPPRFGENVAHGIHSLTLGDLQEFDPAWNKSIPTINLNLTQEDAILWQVPPSYHSPFTTLAMQTLDHVLSHMEDPNYDIKCYSPIERLVHAFHMKEVWSMAKIHYHHLVHNAPENDLSLCSCALDIENNEWNRILLSLRFIALAIREPELVYGRTHARYYLPAVPEQPEKMVLSPDHFLPSIVNEQSWLIWKTEFLKMDTQAHQHLALYLYCVSVL
jgi:hypothetical protein